MNKFEFLMNRNAKDFNDTLIDIKNILLQQKFSSLYELEMLSSTWVLKSITNNFAFYGDFEKWRKQFIVWKNTVSKLEFSNSDEEHFVKDRILDLDYYLIHFISNTKMLLKYGKKEMVEDYSTFQPLTEGIEEHITIVDEQ